MQAIVAVKLSDRLVSPDALLVSLPDSPKVLIRLRMVPVPGPKVADSDLEPFVVPVVVPDAVS